MKAEMTYRDAINACLPKDPRSIYAYFKLGVMLAKRRNDADAWKEASTFLRGYKKYLVAISTIMLEEHLLNRTEEENNESVLPYPIGRITQSRKYPRWQKDGRAENILQFSKAARTWQELHEGIRDTTCKRIVLEKGEVT